MGFWRKLFIRCVGRASSPKRACLIVEALENRLVPYSVTGTSWPRPELVTIGFVPDGTDLGGVASNLISTFNSRFGAPANWQNQILRAAQVWAQQTNLNFALVPDSGVSIGAGVYQQGDPFSADIRIGGYNFGSSTLARAYLPPPTNNFSVAGDIQFNSAQTWVVGSTGGYDLFTVAMHEFGHALGLSHSSDYFSALYPSYAGARAGLGVDDVNGIRVLYSARQVRAKDSFDAVASNNTISTSTSITPLINTSTRSAVVGNRDITVAGDVDYYVFTAPSGTTGPLTVTVQSRGLSLLAPTLTVYNSSKTQLATVSGARQYGTTLTLTVNVTAGRKYYLKVAGAESTAFGTGRYALTLKFVNGVSPVVPLPVTQVANGSPLQSGGALPEVPGHEHEEGDPEADDFPGVRTTVSREANRSAVQTDRNLITVLDRGAGQLPSVLLTSQNIPAPSAPLPISQVFVPAGLLAPSVLRGENIGTTATLSNETGPTLVLPGGVPIEEEVIPAPRIEMEQETGFDSDAVLWPEACDRIFRAPFLQDDTIPAAQDLLTDDEEAVGLRLDGLAAAAILTVALGGYWAAPQGESKRPSRRPFRSG